MAIEAEVGLRLKRAKLWKLRRRTGIILIVPCVVVILAITIFPLLYSLRLSFFRWDVQVPGQPFVGLGNYIQVFQDLRFWASIRNTLIVVVAAVGLEFLVGLILALILVGDLPGKRIMVPILLLPVMVVPIVVGYTWRLMWDAQYGPINQVLGLLLGRDIQFTWLGQTATAFLAVIVTDIWQWAPFMFLVLLAGLSSLPGELFEASSLDGATAFQQLRYLTLPLLRPVMIVALLIRSLDALKLFDIIYALTGGAPGTSTEPFSLYLYRLGFQYFRMGYTAAASYLILVFVSVVITLFIMRMRAEETI